MKRLTASACILLLACSVVWAGNPTKDAATKGMSAKQMEMMKAEMAKCAVCKHMAAHLDEIGPIQMDVVKLNDGVALIHTVDASKADIYHKAGVEMHEAGQSCMSMTDEEAKAQLCPMCQSMRSVMKAGARMSMGTTPNGDIMVLTSSEPQVQGQIGVVADHCAMMAGGGQAKR